MKTFENLEDIWNKQPEVHFISADAIKQKAQAQANVIKVKHTWTIIIIGITVLILASYFVWVAAYKHQTLFIGLGIMITMLLVRFFAEYLSIKKLHALSKEISLTQYATSLQAFYQWRKKIHFVLTPSVYGLYIAGFIMLLPVFKTAFSTGFFWYIIITGVATFIVLGVVIAKQIKKELNMLALLQKHFAGTTK